MINSSKAVVISNTFLTKDVFHLVVEVQIEGFIYKSGQFLSMTIPGGEKPLARAYSIGSRANIAPKAEFYIKKVDGGPGSTYLSELKKGDEILFTGPYGRFTLSNKNDASKLFIATGTGLSPNYAMIREYLESGGKEKIQLLFGVRFKEDLFLIQELDDLASTYSNFSYIKAVSRGEQEDGLFMGRVTDYIKNEIRGNENTEAYICGNKDMIIEARELLQLNGFNKENIHFEQFF